MLCTGWVGGASRSGLTEGLPPQAGWGAASMHDRHVVSALSKPGYACSSNLAERCASASSLASYVQSINIDTTFESGHDTDEGAASEEVRLWSLLSTPWTFVCLALLYEFACKRLLRCPFLCPGASGTPFHCRFKFFDSYKAAASLSRSSRHEL